MVYCLVLEPQAVTPGGQFGALCRAADCITPHLALIAQYAVKHSCTVARHICQTHSPKLYETLWIPSLQLDHASNSMASILVPKASESHQELTHCSTQSCTIFNQISTPYFSHFLIGSSCRALSRYHLARQQSWGWRSSGRDLTRSILPTGTPRLKLNF